MKKTISIAMSLFVVLSIVITPIYAKEEGTKIEGNEQTLSISNGQIAREFSIADGHVRTSAITNKLTDMTISADEQSEDFVIALKEKAIPSGKHDSSLWNATIKGANGEFSQSQIKRIFDDNLDTHVDAPSECKGHPFVVTIDLGQELDIKSMSVNKRPGVTKEYAAQYPHGGKRGVMGAYEIRISNDGVNYTSIKSGEFTENDWNLHSEGNMTNIGDTVHVNFDEMLHTRYIQVIQNSVAFEEDYAEFTTAELDFYSVDYEQYLENTKPRPKKEILSSDLVYKGYEISDIENGKKLTIHYQPYDFEGITYDISQNYMLENDKGYIRSNIEIGASDKVNAEIDYIDVDRFMVDESDTTVWSKPDDSEITSAYLNKHALMLGQPIYMNSFYMGSEFPSAETDIIDGKTQIRYYSGKSFDTLQKQGYLNENGRFVSWNAVVGSATGPEQSVVQTSFYDYIFDIATKSNFRLQYNSWYDSGKGINDSILENLFTETEDALSKQGVRSLDTYVADDGWAIISSKDSTTGFWDFNDKFKDELYPISSTTDKLNSTFGMWISPHGGFGGSDPQTRADMLEEWGTGYAQRATKLWDHVICTGSQKYINNYTSLIRDYEERFGIDYWKFDGFAMDACVNPNHDHITGGPNDMYFWTEKWERWTDAFESMREVNPNVWISGTNHVNLSPWLLQWINSVWVQDSGDRGSAGDTAASPLQRTIYYRDDVYSSLIYQKQVQFPLSNIYNHDPIYTKNDNANTDVFREFMMINAMRGTAFWELYFSPSNMDEEKWMVTADVLDFAEKNHQVSKNAKMFKTEGKNPSQDVYGYSAWTQKKGFISFTNPTKTTKTYTIKLTDIIGVKEGMKNFDMYQIFPYKSNTGEKVVSYGDSITVTLEPFSSQIYEFGNVDSKAPHVISLKMIDDETAMIKFDERIDKESLTLRYGGETVKDMTIQADYRSVSFKVAEFEENKKLDVSVKDMYGNTLDEYSDSIKPKVYLDGESGLEIKGLKEYKIGDNTFTLMDSKKHKVNNAIDLNKEFEISFAIMSEDANKEIMSLENGFRLYIDEEGYLVYESSDGSLSTKEEVTSVLEKSHGTFGTQQYVPTTTATEVIGKVNDGDVHVITINKEANGLMKLYMDARLVSSMESKNEQHTGTFYLGGEGFSGMLSGLMMHSSTKTLDEINAYYHKYDYQFDGSANRDGWTVTVCSDSNEGPKDKVIDGNPNTYWHSAYASNKPTCGHDGETHTLTIDFGKEISFDYLRYTARPKTEKENGLWLKADVYGINQDGSETLLVKNQEITVDENRNFDFHFDGTQHYYGVTFKVEGNNGFATCAEINAYENLDKYQAFSEVTKLMIQANDYYDSLDKNLYVDTTVEELKNVVDEINKLDPFKTEKNVYQSLSKQLEDAVKGLTYKTADYSEVQEAIAKTEALDSKAYTTESWNKLQDALDAVVKDLDITQQDKVNDMAKSINDAISNLVSLGNKDELQSVYDALSKLDQNLYTDDTVRTLKEALANAETVLADDQATVDDVKEATDMLNQATANLVYKDADYSKVDQAIDEANKLNSKDYTTESWNKLQDALDAVVRNLDITKQKQVDKMAENLLEAIKGLELKDQQPETPGKDDVLDTGIQSNIGLYIGGLLIAVAGLGYFVSERKRKVKNKNHNQNAA